MKSTESGSKKTGNQNGLFQSRGLLGYIKELSIVIIGVLVTLSITGMINNNSRQREIRGMMAFVKAELEESLANLEWNQKRWEGEQHLFKLLQQHRESLEVIPANTLIEYNHAIGAVYNPTFISDSYELLKSSLLIQYVKEKDLIRKLSIIYRELGYLRGQLSTYSEQKKIVFLNPMMENMKPGELEIWAGDDPYPAFHAALREDGFFKFIHTGSSILSPASIFEDNKENILSVIHDMNELGY